MKRILSALSIVLLISLCISSCSFSSKTVLFERGSSSKNSYNYDFRDEAEERYLLVEESAKINFKISSKVQSGSVRFELVDENGKILFEESGRKFNKSKTVFLKKGRYTMTTDFMDAKNGKLIFNLKSNKVFRYGSLEDVGEDEEKDKGRG